MVGFFVKLRVHSFTLCFTPNYVQITDTWKARMMRITDRYVGSRWNSMLSIGGKEHMVVIE